VTRVRNYVVIDDRGWLMPEEGHGCWHHRDADFTCRKGMPWSPAEDRAILTLARQLDERRDLTTRGRERLLWEAHHRTLTAIQTRLVSLRAGLRIAALAALAQGAT
jgi:hypothetical protein